MIVAAVATMAGALVAADGYDFTASVKSTKGKGGKETVTFYVNLGVDNTAVKPFADADYWWSAAGYADEKAAKSEVKKLVSLYNKDTTATLDEYDQFDNLPDFLNAVNYIYDTDKDNFSSDYSKKETYKGKDDWCFRFNFKEKYEACYRVAASQKLKGIVAIDACCSGSWEFEAAEGYLADALIDGNDWFITTGLLYRFGGSVPGKATKVEFAGTIGDFVTAPAPGAFALAGQGAWDSKNDMIKNISGNIVGILCNPECENCCKANPVAYVFDCADPDIEAYQLAPNGTAAFGTWSIKYNKKYDGRYE